MIPVFLNTQDQALADAYFAALWDVDSVEDPFVRWMMGSTGMKIARALAVTRSRALAAWVSEHGEDPDGWSLPHPPAVLWSPSVANAACLGCTWLARGDRTTHGCAREARRHAAAAVSAPSAEQKRLLAEPLTVWRADGPPDGLESEEPNEPDSDEPRTPRKRVKAKAGTQPVGFLTSIPRHWTDMTREEQNGWAQEFVDSQPVVRRRKTKGGAQ